MFAGGTWFVIGVKFILATEEGSAFGGAIVGKLDVAAEAWATFFKSLADVVRITAAWPANEADGKLPPELY